MTKRRAPSSDAWTWDLTQREAVRRGWHLERVDWRDAQGYSHDLLGAFDALAWPEDGVSLFELETKRPELMENPAVRAWLEAAAKAMSTKLLPAPTYAIQFTSAPNRAARRKKLQALPILPLLKAAGWVPLVWAWRIKDGRPVLAEDRV